MIEKKRKENKLCSFNTILTNNNNIFYGKKESKQNLLCQDITISSSTLDDNIEQKQ